MYNIRKIAVIFVCLLELGKAQYNYTDKQLEAECKPYFCRTGNDYVEYFQVKSGHRSPGVKFEMHMAIKGQRDGHILLSSTPYPALTDSVYEIVVGAGGNTYSELRRMRKKFGKVSVPTPAILSPSRFVPFWIKVLDDGVIEFGIEGQELAVITYRDPIPIDVNYFSFASWFGVDLKVLYDCPNPGSKEANATIPDSAAVVVKQNLTATDQLRADLLKDYDPYTRPITVNELQTIIFTHFKIKSVKYDVAKSQMTTHGSLITCWVDPKLRFNKTQYNNISEIIFNHKDIWNPDMMVYDSLEMNMLKSDPNLRVIVDTDGFVLRIQSVHLRTWCAPGTRLSHWPHDQHTCSIRIGFWAQDNTMTLADLHKEITALVIQELDDNNSISTEWAIDETIRTTQWSGHSPYANLTHAEDERDDNLFNITVVISRKSKSYGMLLMTPFVASVIIALTTFWLPLSQIIKMTILTGNLIYVSLCLTRVLDEMPTYMQRLPNIVRFYLWSIFSIWLSLIVNGILVKLTSEPRPWPFMHHRLRALLTYSPIALALGLPMIKNQDLLYKPMQHVSSGQEPEDQEDEIEDVEESSDEEGQYWSVLVIAVDRIMFTILIIAYASMLFVHY